MPLNVPFRVARRGGVPILLAFAGTAAITAAPAQAAHQIRVVSNSSAAEKTVAATVAVHAFPGDRCAGVVVKGHHRRDLPGQKLSTSGGAQWSWEPARHVSAGIWKVSVSCRSSRHRVSDSTSFRAAAGTGPGSARQLFAYSTLTMAPTKDDGHGRGGGDEHAVYARGQCTWWAKRKRPDLPYFPGASGDAMNWAKSAEAAKYRVGAVPWPGAVAVWRAEQYNVGKYGHVAYVLAVDGDQIEVSDMNFGGTRKSLLHKVKWANLLFIYGGPQGNPPDPKVVVPPPDPPLAVAMTQPLDTSTVAGTIELRADSNAPQVRFDVFYYSDPAVHTSGVTQHFLDTTPGDGFTASLDTRGIRNQGGTGGTSVRITAVALRSDGSASDAASSIRVTVANPTTVGGRTAYEYYIVGACDASEACAAIRPGPGVNGYPASAYKHDGDPVAVVCQAHGQMVDNPDGTRTDIWDHLADGSWIFDFYVDTPNRGVLSPPVPQCPQATRGAMVQYDCPDQPGAVQQPLTSGQYWRNDFKTIGDQITGGSMAIVAPADGSSHRARVGVYRDLELTDEVGAVTLTIPSGARAAPFTFPSPLVVERGAEVYFGVRAIDPVTAEDQPGTNGCIIGHLDGTDLSYPLP
jgi:surface antigen